MKKRILGLTLAVVMLLCSLTAFAVDDIYTGTSGIYAGDSINIVARFDNVRNRNVQVIITREDTGAVVTEFPALVDNNGSLNINYGTSSNFKIGTYIVTINAPDGLGYGAVTFEIFEEDDSSSSSSSSGSTINSGLIVPIVSNVVPDPLPIGDVPQFTDINGHWAAGPIMQLAQLGIVKGFGDGTFKPEELVTREQFVTMLVNAFGYYDASAVCNFNDVDVDAWYYRYVASGVKAQITRGMGDVFGIGMNITREEMATMCYRLVQNGRVSVSPISDRFEFADMEYASDWAYEPILTMRETGLILGIGDNMFAPKAPSTRAQAAQIIYNLLYGTSLNR